METTKGTCRICGCTDYDCRECIERDGGPCYWVHSKYDLCSACVDYWCVKTLLQYFEYINPKYGLCNFLSSLYYDKEIIDTKDSAEIRMWLENNLPKPKYSGIFESELFQFYSWKKGNIDARWYWLQSKLKQYEQKYN